MPVKHNEKRTARITSKLIFKIVSILHLGAMLVVWPFDIGITFYRLALLFVDDRCYVPRGLFRSFALNQLIYEFKKLFSLLDFLA
jgi:hypothetical protein